MSAYNIIVNDVQKTNNKTLCLARIDNYRNILHRVSVGQFIRTASFNLNFDDSIGTSRWMLIFFPNGQYIESSDSVITESGQASMYLQMVDCEHPHNSLTLTIRFFIKSPYSDVLDKVSSSEQAKFSYRNLYERWSGPFNLATLAELYSNQCKNLFLNDSLTVACEMDDITFRIPSPMNENVYTAFASYTGDELSSSVSYESKDTTLRLKSRSPYTDYQCSSTVGRQLADTASRTNAVQNLHNTDRGNADDRHSTPVEHGMSDSKFCPRPALQSKEDENNSGRSPYV